MGRFTNLTIVRLLLVEGILFFALLHPLVYVAIAFAAVAVYGVYVRLMEKRAVTEFSRSAVADVRGGCLWTFIFTGGLLVPLRLHGNLVIEGIDDSRLYFFGVCCFDSVRDPWAR